jgi:hypothetical protein
VVAREYQGFAALFLAVLFCLFALQMQEASNDIEEALSL